MKAILKILNFILIILMVSYQQRVISKDTADDVLDSLKLVVSDGTGSLAKIIKF